MTKENMLSIDKALGIVEKVNPKIINSTSSENLPVVSVSDEEDIEDEEEEWGDAIGWLLIYP